MINILTEFLNAGQQFDKTTNDSDSLPYGLEDVKIKSNSFVTNSNINNALKKLYDNFVFLYKNCTVGNYSMLGTNELSLSAYSTNENPTNLKVVSFTNSYNDMGVDFLSESNCAALLTDEKNKDFRYLIIANDTKIAGFLIKIQTAELMFSTSLIDTVSGTIEFKGISDIKCYNNDTLYVADSTYNNIVKYDISSLKNRENIYQNKPILRKIIGGIGGFSDRNKFASITKLTVNNNLVVVYDSIDSCIKIYDVNLNWINTISLSRLILDNSLYVTDFLLLDNNDLLCSTNNRIFKLAFNSNTYEVIEEHDLSAFLEIGEYFKGLNQCKYNQNLVLISTNISIKKVWSTQLNQLVSESYFLDSGVDGTIKWMVNSGYDDNSDSVIVFARDSDGGQLLNVYKDSTRYNTILDELDFEVYDMADISIGSEEYVQSWVYMKAFKKIMYNNFLLAKNIRYKFVENPSKSYDVIIDKIYNRSILNFSNDFDFEDNFNIGINEVFQAEVINRVLLEIINFQNLLLNFAINNQNKREFLSPNPFRDRESIKRYYYYADESLFLDPNPSILQTFDELSPGAGLLTSLGGAPYSESGFDDIIITEGITT